MDEPEVLLNPWDMTVEQLETIRRIARQLMDQFKICYTQAVILAYIEWLEMAATEKVEH